MNTAETAYWVDQLFPGQADVTQHDLGEVLGQLTLLSFPQAATNEAIVVTADAGRFESGLVTAETQAVQDGTAQPGEVTPIPLRVELFTTGFAEVDRLAIALDKAVTLLAMGGGAIPPVPGIVLPDVFVQDPVAAPTDPVETAVDAASIDFSAAEGPAVRHGLLVVPFVFGGRVPRMTTDEEMTTLIQLIGITEAEKTLVEAEGVDALQRHITDQGADVRNLDRDG